MRWAEKEAVTALQSLVVVLPLGVWHISLQSGYCIWPLTESSLLLTNYKDEGFNCHSLRQSSEARQKEEYQRICVVDVFSVSHHCRETLTGFKISVRQLARFSCCHKKKDDLFYLRNTLVSVEDFTLWKMSLGGEITALPKKAVGMWKLCKAQDSCSKLSEDTEPDDSACGVLLLQKSPPWWVVVRVFWVVAWVKQHMQCFFVFFSKQVKIVSLISSKLYAFMDNECPSGCTPWHSLSKKAK